MTLTIKKLSERNLQQVLEVLFPQATIVAQKRFKSEHQAFIADYYIETESLNFVFEFDGPSHYNNTKTQIRDVRFVKFCEDNKLVLVRIPYFLQIDNRSIHVLFKHEHVERFRLEDKIVDVDCKYVSGFHDSGIVYPGDYNEHGWKLFWNFYKKMCMNDVMSVMKQIFESVESKNANLVLGIGWEDNEEKTAFWENYPT